MSAMSLGIFAIMLLLLPLAFREVRFNLRAKFAPSRKYIVFGEKKEPLKYLYLVEKHPSTGGGLVFEFRDAPIGEQWGFSWFNQPMSWVYEIQDDKEHLTENIWVPRLIEKTVVDKDDKVVEQGTLSPFDLFNALDWRRAVRLLAYKQSLLEKIQGYMLVFIGLGCVFGIIAIIDMLGQEGV